MTKYIIPCTRCHGSGHFQGFGTCFNCNGTTVQAVTKSQYDAYHTKKGEYHYLCNV